LTGLPISRTRKVALVAMLTALAVATDYAMLPLANVKLMDSIVFVASLAFGLEVGVSVGALTWLVYGEVNPLGPDGGVLLLVLIGSETVYALLGYFARRFFDPDRTSLPARSLLWGSLGLIGAFTYDLITNVVPPLLAGDSLSASLLFLVPGAPFMLAHEVSDFVFFSAVAPLLYGAIRKVARRQGILVASPQVLAPKP
jgi:uncharacterized membrane protein